MRRRPIIFTATVLPPIALPSAETLAFQSLAVQLVQEVNNQKYDWKTFSQMRAELNRLEGNLRRQTQ